MPMVTKLNRVVEYSMKVPPVKSHDPLIKWFEVSNKLDICPISLVQWPPNMASW